MWMIPLRRHGRREVGMSRPAVGAATLRWGPDLARRNPGVVVVGRGGNLGTAEGAAADHSETDSRRWGAGMDVEGACR